MKILLAAILCAVVVSHLHAETLDDWFHGLMAGAGAAVEDFKKEAAADVVLIRDEKDEDKVWKTLSKIIEICDLGYVELLALYDMEGLKKAMEAASARSAMLKYKCESCQRAIVDCVEKAAKKKEAQPAQPPPAAEKKK
jgi:hypothetical protein